MKRALFAILGVMLFLVLALTARIMVRNRPLPPTASDVPIVERTLVLLENEATWSKDDARQCESNTNGLSLYCALRQASLDVTGEFHHRAAALQAVRHAVDAMYPADYAHRLQDFNNRPDITLSDVRAVLFRAMAALEGEKRVIQAIEFRRQIERGDLDDARAMMATDPRRWWDTREGEGDVWSIDPGAPGPWAAWDDEFKSRKLVVEWKQDESSATAVTRETNDYFALLDRGWVTSEITYFFDAADLIDGLLIRAVGERPPGRTDEFLSWARANDPAELDTLMPAGEVDPSGDHPQRFRHLLMRWHEAAAAADSTD